MIGPVFVRVTPDLHGSLINRPDGRVVTSCYHIPTGRTLYGLEDDLQRAYSWLDGAKLLFGKPEGTA